MFDKSFHRIHLNTREAERKGESLWTFFMSAGGLRSVLGKRDPVGDITANSKIGNPRNVQQLHHLIAKE
jgi:hypothetical protein